MSDIQSNLAGATNLGYNITSFSGTVASSGVNRIAVVISIGQYANADMFYVNGVSMSISASQIRWNGQYYDYQFEQVWTLIAPPVGTLTITGTANSAISCGAGVMVFNNINQVSPVKEVQSHSYISHVTFSAADTSGAMVALGGSGGLPSGFTQIMIESNFSQGVYKLLPTATQYVDFNSGANNSTLAVSFRYVTPIVPNGNTIDCISVVQTTTGVY
jgi:hypothetical protein